MEIFDFEGKTTEEAIQNASRKLNLPVEELHVDIIEPGSAGIFGLVGGKKAKIKVQIKTRIEEEIKVEEEDHGEANGIEIAQEALHQILSLIPIDAGIQAQQMDGKVNLIIEGDRSGLLIGRKGKTLDALQYIVNKIVNKNLPEKVDVIIDSEDYRKRKKESLTQLALKMGEKAKKIKKPLTTNPLNPHDRRIVHLALRDDEALDTRSRGEGLLKRVVIIPRNK